MNPRVILKTRWMLAALLLPALLLVSCGDGSGALEAMIPADATGVVCIDVPQVLKRGGLLNDGEVKLPKSLQEVIENNDDAPLCVLLTDLPRLGLDTGCKAYGFFTTKTFGSVWLARLDDAELARQTIAQRVGGDWQQVDGVDCMSVRDNLFAIDDKVLLVGHVNKSLELAKLAKAARNILKKGSPSITSNKAVMAVLHDDDGAVNAWMQLKGLRTLLGKSEVYRDLVSKMPLIEVFTESDIDAVTCQVSLEEDEVELDANIAAAKDSEYAQLLTRTLGKPSDEVLKAIPNSMDYIVTMSVQGENFVQLQQIQQLLGMFGKLPYIGKIDLASILKTVDGPFAVGVARDPHLEGEWNAVLAMRSTDPDAVVKQISTFANSMGQAPELYDGEYVYQYDNKMIRIGITDGVLYMKMLDYEQTEGYAYELPQAREFMDDALLGVFMQTHTDSVNGYLDFGLTDIFNGEGHFTTDSRQANVTLELLRALCSIKGSSPFDGALDEDEDEGDLSSLMGGAIDRLKPVQ